MANKRRRLSDGLLWALAAITAIAVLLFVLWWGPWLFTRHPSSDLTDADALKARNDVRTTLVQAVAGLAVAAGAFVTYRTFTQNQVDQARRHDREERTYKLNQSQQVTDTYTKAVEQLGHDEAPVRLGALYSLVSLAQDNPSRRQTVVDVLCAYLRMPYVPLREDKSATDPVTAATDSPPNPEDEQRQRDAAQELQVRQTAQRLLVGHLRRPQDTSGADAQSTEPSPEATFWPGMSIELTGAFLVGSWMHVSVIRADFSRAVFDDDDAQFKGAAFSGDVTFDRATFPGYATFDDTVFSGYATFNDADFVYATFDDAAFSGDATFDRATFHVLAQFDRVTFSGDASFQRTAFLSDATFDRATFGKFARFVAADFSGGAQFPLATFSGPALFTRSTWSEDALFNGAAFYGGATFERTTFLSHADFHLATFADVIVFDRANFSRNPCFKTARLWDISKNASRIWSGGWTVSPDENDPTRGTLVPAVDGEAADDRPEPRKEDH